MATCTTHRPPPPIPAPPAEHTLVLNDLELRVLGSVLNWGSAADDQSNEIREVLNGIRDAISDRVGEAGGYLNCHKMFDGEHWIKTLPGATVKGAEYNR